MLGRGELNIQATTLLTLAALDRSGGNSAGCYQSYDAFHTSCLQSFLLRTCLSFPLSPMYAPGPRSRAPLVTGPGAKWALTDRGGRSGERGHYVRPRPTAATTRPEFGGKNRRTDGHTNTQHTNGRENRQRDRPPAWNRASQGLDSHSSGSLLQNRDTDLQSKA